MISLLTIHGVLLYGLQHLIQHNVVKGPGKQGSTGVKLTILGHTSKFPMSLNLTGPNFKSL